MALSMRTGISPAEWRKQDPADLWTAFDLLEKEDEELEDD